LGANHPEHCDVAPRLSRSHRVALSLLVVLFGVGVAAHLHGFSLAAWHAYIDDSPAEEVLLGRARPIRSDDWAVQIPLCLAQLSHEPAYPVVNSNIGWGENMLAPLQSPVAHVATLFRPALWGYFLGADSGIAWMWWFELLGLIGAFSCVFAWVGRGRTALAFAAAVFLAYAPFFQYWSLNAAPGAIFAGLAVLGSQLVLASRSRRGVVLGGALLAWGVGCFGLVLYPPYMAVLAQLGILLALAGAWASRGVWGPRRRGDASCERDAATGARLAAWRIGALAGAAVVVAAAGCLFFFATREAIELVDRTVYPGHRVATGGGVPYWRLFSSNLALAWFADDYGPLHNICEAAAFPLFFPVVGAALALSWWRSGRRPDPLALALTLYCCGLGVYQQWGLPDWLARATLLRYASAPRTALGTGLADVLLLVRFLSDPESRCSLRAGRREAAAIAAAWGAILVAAAWRLATALPAVPFAPLCVAAAVNAIAAYAILAVRRPTALMACLAAAAVLTTGWFNPIARGGSDYLRENELSSAILDIDASLAGDSVWLTYGSPKLPNLIWAIGVRSLNGTHAVPQFELWRALDPARRYEHVYNRYAHVEFAAAPTDRARIQLRRHDIVRVTLSPLAPVVRGELGVTHLLLHARPSERAAFERWTGLESLFATQRNAIYALRTVRGGDPPAAGFRPTAGDPSLSKR
jgi:hypothetical protein